ncbi:LOW QUALITY PROTEIN: protein artichoke-like [Uloborus diversus]|uniref:LOW QUALITY PROTEIN: protein artichoke-like n=1 Tax=Uloborus diversus TaxID=327109 RepID=UPI00240A61EB|nr:LOW QUALITY PROTEIN: protein artichoke-like [Uloborus diversus]
MDTKQYLLFGLLLWLYYPLAESRCPKACTCALKLGKKTVHCSGGALSLIPVSEMDTNTHELVVTAPPGGPPNNITIGRIFLKQTNLEVVRITRSNVPAIGDRTFWPGRRMRVLDLSHNAITFLSESDFVGLKNLQELYLSDNLIFASPSAPFRHLISLRKLSLARNKLQTLVPRLFYLLSHLEELDLSGNALRNIEYENLQDVKALKVLKLANCRLSHLHPIIYQQLPLLEELDLKDNLIASLAPAEFRHLSKLSILHLDGNLLKSITDGTFHDHKLSILGLSRNIISVLSDHAFINSSVTFLDLSRNRLDYVLRDTFQPLSHALEVLNISFNDLGNQAFSSIVSPLESLKILEASNLMVSYLSPDTFSHNYQIKRLNLSGNSIVSPHPSSLSHLEQLEDLDLSFNAMPLLSVEFLQGLDNITSLKVLRLHGNPFDCSDCFIEPFIQWLNASQIVEQNCSTDECLTCRFPPEMNGHLLTRVSPDDVWCSGGVYERQFLAYTSQIGMIVAVSIIVIIVCIILIIIIIYRRHIAHYYTGEEERGWKGMYENPALAPSGGVHYRDDKPTFISSSDKVDENIEEFRSSSIMR